MARTALNLKTAYNARKVRTEVNSHKLTLDGLEAAQASNSDKLLGFTGRNGAGACTATGARVGDLVLGVVNITDGGTASANFEAAVTIADQIQQSSATDLSAKKFSLLVRKKVS